MVVGGQGALQTGGLLDGSMAWPPRRQCKTGPGLAGHGMAWHGTGAVSAAAHRIEAAQQQRRAEEELDEEGKPHGSASHLSACRLRCSRPQQQQHGEREGTRSTLNPRCRRRLAASSPGGNAFLCRYR